MAEDPIRKYSGANKEFNDAYMKIRKIGEIISDVGRHLNNRPHVFGMTGVGVNFPPEIGLAKPVFGLDANNWPSAQQIAEAILDLHEKRQKVRELYQSLSATDTSLINKPDLYESG